MEAASKAYNNVPFVFKHVTVSSYMLSGAADDIFNVGTIRCKPLVAGAVSKIKNGDIIDVVGMNRGAIEGDGGWLLFTECIFLPAGSVDLPAPGAATGALVY